MNFLAVFLGGGLGAMARYGIAKLTPISNSGFPVATFLANVISCIILGIFIGMVTKEQLSSKMQLLLLTGFCGGFSTFSTFSAETFRLIEQGQLFIAFSYLALSILVCLAGIFIGLKLMS